MTSTQPPPQQQQPHLNNNPDISAIMETEGAANIKIPSSSEAIAAAPPPSPVVVVAPPPPVLIPPINFSMVAPGIYRSGYPSRKNFRFLQKIGIRSILCLTPEKYADNNMEFARQNGVRVLQYGIEGNKEPFVHIPEEVVRRAVVQVLNTMNQPVLIHCVEGSMQVSLGNGLSRRMDSFLATDGKGSEASKVELRVENVLSWGESDANDRSGNGAMESGGGGGELVEEGDIVHARTSHAIRQGTRDCLKLILEDGRELIVTEDHRVLTATVNETGAPSLHNVQWKEAGSVQPGSSNADRIVCSLIESVADDNDAELDSHSDFTLFDGRWTMSHDRNAILAFSRLCGATQGSNRKSNDDGGGFIFVKNTFDAEQIAQDIELIEHCLLSRGVDTGHIILAGDIKDSKDPADPNHGSTFQVPISENVRRALQSVGCAFLPKSSGSIHLPDFLHCRDCPRSVRREFIAAWWGKDGVLPHYSNDQLSGSCRMRVSVCVDNEVQSLEELSKMRDMVCDIILTKRETVQVRVKDHFYYDHHKRIKITFPPNQRAAALQAFDNARMHSIDCTLMTTIEMSCDDLVVPFMEQIGVRYNLHKWRQLSAAASYLRHSRKFNDPCKTVAHNASFDRFARSIGFDKDTQASNRSVALRVMKVERVGDRPVYDLTVPKHHNFLASGCVVHNCNKGKHRTGVLVGCVRKVQRWSLTSIFDEYRRFAGNKVRLLDQQFIELFDVAQVWPLIQPSRVPHSVAHSTGHMTAINASNGGDQGDKQDGLSSSVTSLPSPLERKTITFDKIMTETHDVIIMVEQQPFVPPRWLLM